MERQEVKKDLLIRLITNYCNVPAGTWATVSATGTMNDGVWWFTVQWQSYKPIPSKFPHGVTEYSLNLWEADLVLFEVVSPQEEQAARRRQQESESSSTPAPIPHLNPRSRSRRLSGNASGHPNQLSLFAIDDF
jgi:hypothetical protein